MPKIIQNDFVKNLTAYLLERPAKEVMNAIMVLERLPDAPEAPTIEPPKEGA